MQQAVLPFAFNLVSQSVYKTGINFNGTLTSQSIANPPDNAIISSIAFLLCPEVLVYGNHD
jgi:hypothetical protein